MKELLIFISGMYAGYLLTPFIPIVKKIIKNAKGDE